MLLTRPNWATKVRELRRREMEREKSENLRRKKILFATRPTPLNLKATGGAAVQVTNGLGEKRRNLN